MNRVFKYMLAVAIGAAVVGGGLYAGGIVKDIEAIGTGDPMNNYFSQEMPRFEGAPESPLGAGISLGGMPMEIAWFTTDKNAKDVSDFYINKFKSMKLAARVMGKGDSLAVVADDKKTGTRRLVAIERKGERTYVFPSIVRLDGAPDFKREPAADIYAPDDQAGYMELRSSDYGRTGRVISFAVPRGVDETMKQFAEGMARKGWKDEGALGDPEKIEGKVLSFKREGATALVTLARSGSGTSVLLNIQGGEAGR